MKEHIEKPITRPEWIRLPAAGEHCPHSGLKRSYLFNLTKSGKVKSFVLRERNARRGVRLVNYDSLLAYLADQATSAAGGADQ